MYLSVSGLKNYLSCPKKYELAQQIRLRPIVPKAYFAFGKAIHKGIELKIIEGKSPAETFQETWEYERAVDLDYGSRDSHSSLMEQGKKMLKVWETDITTLKLLEVPAKAEVSVFKEVDGVPLFGIIDFLSLEAVIDWKTASSEFGEDKALDLQLPYYSLLLGEPEVLYGFGVLIKKKNPLVQYVFFAPKGTKELKEIIQQAWEGILAGKFPRIPNSTCSFCDYLPLCLGKEGAESMFTSNEKI